MSVEDLKALVREEDPVYMGARPATGDGLATLLIRHILPDATDAEVALYLARRHEVRPARHDSMLGEENADVAEGILDEAAEEEMHGAIAARTAQHRATGQSGGSASSSGFSGGEGSPAPPLSDAEAAAPTAPAAVPLAPASPARTAAPAAPPAAKVPVPDVDATASSARPYLPRVAGCTISPYKGYAWLVKYLRRSVYPKSHFTTFTEHGGTMASLRECLAWAWAVHAQEVPTDPQCPWELPAIAV